MLLNKEKGALTINFRGAVFPWLRSELDIVINRLVSVLILFNSAFIVLVLWIASPVRTEFRIVSTELVSRSISSNISTIISKPTLLKVSWALQWSYQRLYFMRISFELILNWANLSFFLVVSYEEAICKVFNMMIMILFAKCRLCD